jgi:PAS domain S-box-containing protein
MDHLAKYRLAFEIAPLPLALISRKGDILLANDRFCALFGHDRGGLQGVRVETLLPPEARDTHPRQRGAYFRQPIKRGMGAGRDLEGLTRQSARIPLELAIEPVSLPNQSCVLLTAMDISERKQREQHLREALDATTSGMLLADGYGTIRLINAAACDLLGYTREELLDQPIDRLVPQGARVAHEVYMRNARHGSITRRMGQSQNIHARHKSGAHIPVDIALTQIDMPAGPMIMATITDLRQQIAFEEAMREKNATLALLNDELSQFAYSASHDLKAPLLSVIGLLRICLEDLGDGRDGAPDSELAENLRRALDISSRSAAQVEGILELARAGQTDLETGEVDLAALVHDLWENMTGADTGPKLTLAIPAGLMLCTEKVTLRIILDNLIGNALKYSDPRKNRVEVRIEASTWPDGTDIHVRDNGCGIEKAHQTRMFEMFKRFDDRSGAGLGLALVNKHVGRLGGTISVDSEPGRGTCMSVRLPARETAPP